MLISMLTELVTVTCFNILGNIYFNMLFNTYYNRCVFRRGNLQKLIQKTERKPPKLILFKPFKRSGRIGRIVELHI